MTAISTPIDRTLDTILDVLRCPDCAAELVASEDFETVVCQHCSSQYPCRETVPFLFRTDDLQQYLELDERHRKKEKRARRGRRGGSYHWDEYSIETLLPAADGLSKRVLLLGCGDAGERARLEARGYETVGFDIVRSAGVDFLADAHNIPVQTNSFDIVLSMQVLEHVHSPWIVAQEIARALRPGGWFVGSVAFLKPYHRSYFHISHLGMISLLAQVGLVVEEVYAAQSAWYSILGSQLPLGPRHISRQIYGALERLVTSLRVKTWAWTRRLDPDKPSDRFQAGIPMSFRQYEKLRIAPAVVFRARRPLESSK